MEEPRIDNKMLDLLYDEVEGQKAEKLREDLGVEAQKQLDELSMVRGAFQDLSADDELSPTARANILREARVTAANIVEKNQKPAFPWLAAVVMGAAAVLLGVGTWVLFANPPSTDTNTAPQEERVATATGTDPLENTIAKQTPAEEMPEEAFEEVNEPAAAAAQPDADAQPDPADQNALANEQALEDIDDLRTDTAKQKRPSPDKSDKDNAPQKDRMARSQNSNKPTDFKADGFDADYGDAEETESKVAKAEDNDFDLDKKKKEVPRIVAENRAGSATSGGISGVATEESQPAKEQTTADAADVANAGAFQQGVASYEAGAWDDAVAQLTVALDAGLGDRPTALLLRGKAYQKQGKNIDAIADLRELIEKHSGFGRRNEAEFALAECLESVNSPDAAKEHYESVADSKGSLSEEARKRADSLQSTIGGGGTGDGDKAAARKKTRKAKKKAEKSTDRSKDAKKRSMDAADEMYDDSKGSVVY